MLPELSITALNLSGCLISDAGLQSLAKATRALNVLNINNCCNVSDVGARSLFEQCPNLNTIDAHCCDQISDALLEYVSQQTNRTPLVIRKY